MFRVPTDRLVSPQDATPVKAIDRTFRDQHDNEWSVDELSRCRPANAIRNWFDEAYPRE